MGDETSESSQDTPNRKGPGRPRDAGRDKAILDATMEILLDQGYAGLTIESVAARAGVGRPTIYRRWPSKPALVVAALVQSPQVAIPDADTGSLRGDLVAIQRRQVALMNTPMARRVTAGLIADLAADRELGERYISLYLVPRREAVSKVLQRAIDRGELDPGVDVNFIYELLIGPLFMRAVVWGQPLPRDLAETTTDVILNAFANPSLTPGAVVGRSRAISAHRR